ncbi:uncharacterized protein LOC108253911 [Diaphorina citri]|uniref:Uncharacterized protein LOC108253911 n=1 Tax=Diaphorina citri TaxID=121845 RepID=A0A1S4EQ93_DIACI|nr:uncharacterized protein LOC108253911 [Diaphorina citri]
MDPGTKECPESSYVNITDLWTLDVLGIRDPLEKTSKLELEQATLEHFMSTVTTNSEDNYNLSLKRLESTVRRLKREGVLRTCVTCKRYNAKKLEVHPTPLPQDRVRNAKVFEVSGCDLAGPLYIKTETGTSKVWVCLFTCAVYRAVHLELVTSLSTDSFLQALRRFVSHHGRCRVMYSDQGTNFKGFDTACEKLDWTAVMQFSGARRIQWKFNPPSAPWWGGFFERIVGIVKGLLKRVLGHSLVTYETMLTLLKEVESVINNRPLTYLSEDPQDLSVLTPAMFLHELEDSGVPELDLIENADLRVQFKHRQDLRRQLRERFTAEYLETKSSTANVRTKPMADGLGGVPVPKNVKSSPGKDELIKC